MTEPAPIPSCTHRAPHYHGTRAGYDVCGCRCPDCYAALVAYKRETPEARAERLRRKRHADAERVRVASARLHRILDAGHTLAWTAAQVGTTATTIAWIRDKHSKSPHPDLTRAIGTLSRRLGLEQQQRTHRIIDALDPAPYERGACIGVDPATFDEPRMMAVAAKVCATCPVMGACHANAITSKAHEVTQAGYWWHNGKPHAKPVPHRRRTDDDLQAVAA